mmetsp:Transcript_6039/g.6798  ORF Transcript_6039/g.6798 Transcript_6039/m.6798 type:complete len:248 (+) Transcript_6039:109-852(+)
MRFDEEEEGNSQELKELACKKKAQKNWRNLAKTILNRNTEGFRTLVKSVNQYMYPQLKRFAVKIMSPKFQSIMAMLKNFPEDKELDDKMMYAKEGIVQLEQIIKESTIHFSVDFDLDDDFEINEDSLISSLLKIKRSKLEVIVEKLAKLYEKKPKKFAKKAISQLAKDGICQYKLNRITKKVVKSSRVKSSKCSISITSPKSVSFAAFPNEKEKPLNPKKKLFKPKRKLTLNSLASVEEFSDSVSEN